MNEARRLRTVGLVPHRDRPEARDLAARVVAWFEQHEIEVRIPESDAVRARSASAVPVEEFAAGLDLALSLGGDGTMLRTVDLVYDAGVPVLGVNVGQLGYLAEVEPEDLDAVLDKLVAGDYVVADRMMLSVTVESDGPAAGRWWALNESGAGEAAPGTARPPRRRDQRRVLHLVRGGRRDRGDARPAPPRTRSRRAARSCRRGCAACC